MWPTHSHFPTFLPLSCSSVSAGRDAASVASQVWTASCVWQSFWPEAQSQLERWRATRLLPPQRGERSDALWSGQHSSQWSVAGNTESEEHITHRGTKSSAATHNIHFWADSSRLEDFSISPNSDDLEGFLRYQVTWQKKTSSLRTFVLDMNTVYSLQVFLR